MPISNTEISEILYGLLPELYREQDLKAKPIEKPLKRFLEVASVGLKAVEKEIDDVQLLYDTSLIPDKYLDLMIRQLGYIADVSFMDNASKRRLISNLPYMYKIKGNVLVFDVLAKVIFGNSTNTQSYYYEFEDGITYLVVDVNILTDDVLDIEGTRKRFNEMSEIFRPVNVKVRWVINLIYPEHTYNRNLIPEETTVTQIIINESKDFDALGNAIIKPEFKNVQTDTVEKEFLHVSITEIKEIFEKVFSDISPVEIIKMQEGIENAKKSTSYTGEDTLVNVSARLNFGILGSTMKLSSPRIIERTIKY